MLLQTHLMYRPAAHVVPGGCCIVMDATALHSKLQQENQALLAENAEVKAKYVQVLLMSAPCHIWMPFGCVWGGCCIEAVGEGEGLFHKG